MQLPAALAAEVAALRADGAVCVEWDGIEATVARMRALLPEPFTATVGELYGEPAVFVDGDIDPENFSRMSLTPGGFLIIDPRATGLDAVSVRYVVEEWEIREALRDEGEADEVARYEDGFSLSEWMYRETR
ncbi:hypothetical protein BIV57_17935 [Mangrovactinospora gilvigrisea]|uniref:Uncharacterized protein n=1 Tax=Mangrovactinospora gilvigrisea TaxID=1428644 RepID=A0A1J7BBV9_9ACTN|nr:hypothetical protein [Mangrovactinospora gilvigrisea]OIV36118.1 hypothetical protein BIV57_17935 [Mangrovactinospora gilvigrisea]